MQPKPNEYYVRDWAKDAAFIRKARKLYRCCGGHDGEQRIQCALPIQVGELHVEYCGESHPYMSGNRHHLTCAAQHGLIALASDQGADPIIEAEAR